jgi:hypothetical protein
MYQIGVVDVLWQCIVAQHVKDHIGKHTRQIVWHHRLQQRLQKRHPSNTLASGSSILTCTSHFVLSPRALLLTRCRIRVLYSVDMNYYLDIIYN